MTKSTQLKRKQRVVKSVKRKRATKADIPKNEDSSQPDASTKVQDVCHIEQRRRRKPFSGIKK